MIESLADRIVNGPKLNILAFSFFPAVVPPTSGGETRLYELLTALSEHHFIRLISSSWLDRSTTTVRHGANFRETQVQKPFEIERLYSELATLSSSGADVSGPAVYLAGLTPNEMHKVYFDQYEGVDVIIHESPFTISYDVMAGADLIPRIYNSYNCETQLYAQMHPGAEAQKIRDLVREAECRLLDCIDLYTYCASDDQRLIAGLTKRELRSVFVPNGGADRNWLPPRRPRSELRQAIFVGSDHQPNREAAHFIATTLAVDCPEVIFHITGRCLPEGDFPSNVRRHGFVSETVKNELLTSSDIALNPVVTGSGSNLKITEYLSYGLPILSTRFGVRGTGLVAGAEYLEADRKDFSSAFRRAIADPSFLDEVGNAGRQRFRQTLTWTSIAARLAEEVAALCQKGRSRRARPVLALNDYDFTQVQSGGATRIRGLYEQMRSERDVFYVVVWDSPEWMIDHSIEGITLFKMPKAANHRHEELRINGRFHLSASDIVSLYMLPQNWFLVALLEVLKKCVTCIITDHIYMSGLVGPDDTWIYSSQNHETSLKSEILDGHPDQHYLVDKVKKAEERALRTAKFVICVSDDDAAKMVAGHDSSVPTIIVTNGVLPPSDADQEAASHLDLAIGERSCVFVGSGHPPNVEACKFLVNEVAPLLPDVEFHLAGSVSYPFVTGAPPNVRVWGRLDEPHKIALLRSSRLALNPVDSGGGSNVKVADYFSQGLQVLSTPFGLRGFPDAVKEAVSVAERHRFADAISRILAGPEQTDGVAKRRGLFNQFLNVKVLGRTLARAVSALKRPKRRILFVTYRLTYPPRGGAEMHLLKLVGFLANSGDFDIDIVAPDIDLIGDESRFAGTYSADPVRSGPFGLPHVRWARFPVNAARPKGTDEKLVRLWEAQAAFERALTQQSADRSEPILLWGWGPVEGHPGSVARWAFAEAAVFVPNPARLVLTGFAHNALVMSSTHDSATVITARRLEGPFRLETEVNPGVFSFRITKATDNGSDPRPLGLLAESIEIDGDPVTRHALDLPSAADADRSIARLAEAAQLARRGCSLSDVRGPFSSALETWIEQNITDYDLLLTHNNIFRPVVRSLELAAQKGVPSILVPHSHLDDDYYHFPDMVDSVKQASAVLACPSAAVRYLSEYNPSVHYHCPGIDLADVPSPADIQAFRGVYLDTRPFVLVLGRKAAAKNYTWVIDSAKSLGLPVLLVGPDDDGAIIADLNVTYLGRQPSAVVRGALSCCLFLANMSTSESFGMVILEAWLARKAVIANRHCAAFQDLVKDGENGLLCSRAELTEVMQRLCDDEQWRAALGDAGFRASAEYDWSHIGHAFELICGTTINQRARRGGLVP